MSAYNSLRLISPQESELLVQLAIRENYKRTKNKLIYESWWEYTLKEVIGDRKFIESARCLICEKSFYILDWERPEIGMAHGLEHLDKIKAFL